MPIDPAELTKSTGTLTDLHPEQDLAATLQEAVVAAKSLFDADAAGIMLADMGQAALGQRLGPARPDPGRQPGGVRRRPVCRGVHYQPAGGHA